MNDTRAALADLPILRFLPPEVRAVVTDSFVPASFDFGSVVVQEGEEADALYVLLSGRARVLKLGDTGEEVVLNELRPGDTFGEMGILDRTRRTATVRASSRVEVLRLDRSIFTALLGQTPELRTYFELQVKHRRLNNFFRHYAPFGRLPPDALETLVRELEPVAARPGEVVIRQGDEPGPLYVIEEGRLRVSIEEDGARRYVGYLRSGDFFGEMSVFRGARRSASVEAVSSCRLLALKPGTFRRLVAAYPEFSAQIEQRIAQHDYRHVARVPLDFAEELLPVQAAAHETVGPGQVDATAAAAPEDEAGRPGPFATPEGQFVKRGGRIRWMAHVQQADAADSGAAALAMVCRHFGRTLSLARVRQLVHATAAGASLRALCQAAVELGLAARALKASARDLDELPLPAIVHTAGAHWLVLYDVDRDVVRVADPAVGLRRQSRRQFEEAWSGYAALFDYTEAFPHAPEAGASAAWLWPLFRPFTGVLLKAAVLAIVVAALQMVLPVSTQVIVDRVLVEQDVGLLTTLVITMVAVLVAMIAAMLVQRYLLSFVAVHVDAQALDLLTRKLLALPMSYFHGRSTGEIQSRLDGLRQVREFVVQYAVTGLSSVVQLVAALTLMFVYSPVLGGVFLLTAPLYALLMRVSAKWLQPIFDRMEHAFGRYRSYQIDAIKGIETVKAMGAEGAFREMMLNEFLTIARKRFNADFTIMCYEGGVQAVTFLSVVLFLWIGSSQVMSGALTIGGLVAFNSLIAMANAPVGNILALWDNLQLARVLLDRLHDVFRHEPEQGTDHSYLVPVRTLEGKVALRNVGFRYGGPDSPPILSGITADVPPGKVVAIVGRSGSGKTTLVRCLAGLLEPTEGAIFHDGIDLRTLNYRDLRRQIGYVLQENHVFSDTIARNIAFGDPQPDMDAVVWAARVAHAAEFVERLPLAYDTPIGESGIALSGGQRQRIAIARALYRRPPILIFDEATSALDTESEHVLKENMDKLVEGRTSFVIAHRLSTIRDADMILVLDQGKLVEQGSHETLMARQGIYYYLVSQQLGL